MTQYAGTARLFVTLFVTAIAMIFLKAIGAIDLCWAAVLSPLWAPSALLGLFLLGVYVIALVRFLLWGEVEDECN